jgi:hypothetical protein
MTIGVVFHTHNHVIPDHLELTVNFALAAPGAPALEALFCDLGFTRGTRLLLLGSFSKHSYTPSRTQTFVLGDTRRSR